ncbi:MAG: amidohydrolase [Pirellulales bacterium]|nr:amidohydrolase [Pirellulales bacterium]
MTRDWRLALDAEIARVTPQLIELRRQMHAHPELSGTEHATTERIERALAAAGIAGRRGPDGRGLIVDSPGASAARVALRADIDALPIAEARDCDYRSQSPGIMHACGHDGHTAVVLGCVLALHQLQTQGALPGGIAWRALFQPAEETLLGAKEMVAAGAVEDVATILSMHMDPTREVGQIGVCDGPFTAHCDTLKVTLHGRGGHGARPHLAIDPLAAAVQLVNTLYAVIPRRHDSLDAVVISFGQFTAGDAANVIPSVAELRGTLRTLDRRVREATKIEIARIIEAVAAATGTRAEFDWYSGIDSVVNDPAVTNLVRQAGAEVLGQQSDVQEILRPSMGSEDFASYLEHVPGSMFRLGCASPAVGNSGLHTPTFDLDERAIPIGARILVRAAVLSSEQPSQA